MESSKSSDYSHTNAFSLRYAQPAEAALIKQHYDAVIQQNNILRTRRGERRYIDWMHPFPLERVEAAIAQNGMMVVGPRHAPGEYAVLATFITEQTPNSEIWQGAELPKRALGFGKFAVAADLLGQGFGRSVALPLLIDHARSRGFDVLYCDALPHLDSYYRSMGFEDRGPGSFYSNYYAKRVAVSRHALALRAR